MGNQLQTIDNRQVTELEGVRCYLDENGTAYLDAEAVARGLGITQMKNGVEYVRYDRISAWLKEFGFPHAVGKGDFIPENMFYRLSMKANNAAAQKFQAKVADEILPSIRKHGVYMTTEAAEKIFSNPDFIIQLAQQVKDAKAKIAELENQVAVLEKPAAYCNQVLLSDEHLTSELIAKDYGHSATWLNNELVKLDVWYKRGRRYFLKAKYANLGYRISETVTLDGGKTVTNHYWTQKGREFIYHFLKKYGIVPIRERQALSDTLF